MAVLLVSRTSTWRPRFGVALVAITVASLAFSIYLTANNPPVAFFVTTTRAWEFGAGGLLAFVGIRAAGRARPIMAWVGVAMVAVAAVYFTAGTRIPGYAAALPVVGTVLV